MRNLSLALFATLLATPLIAQEKPINLTKEDGRFVAQQTVENR